MGNDTIRGDLKALTERLRRMREDIAGKLQDKTDADDLNVPAEPGEAGAPAPDQPAVTRTRP